MHRCRSCVVIAAAALRGADFHVRASGVAWFVAAAVLFVVLMYGIAETLASRIHQQEEYIARHPGDRDPALVLRGRAVPDRRAARCADRVREGPAAHPRDGAHALRPRSTRAARGLHDIWGMSNTTAEAWLSLGVVALFAVAFMTVAIRAFTRSAVS